MTVARDVKNQVKKKSSMLLDVARVARLAFFRPENTNLAYFELLGCKILAFGIFPKTGIFLAYFEEIWL